MPATLIATKLNIPPQRTKTVLRSHLIERLQKGLLNGCRLTLISAPAGFGKTTLISEWISTLASASPSKIGNTPKVAWLSLDDGDNDPVVFVLYIIAALQTLWPEFGAGITVALQSPQPPPVKAILPALVNEIVLHSDRFALVLDDYHVIENQEVDQVLDFLLEHQPPQMHLIIASREDPDVPMARLRARSQLSEFRTADLRFEMPEATEFLNRVMGLTLIPGDIAALEARTEGWIAGLQLAAISLQGHKDIPGFIQSFTGSHRFVLDYLLEEVLHQQSKTIQTFLLHTAILERMCGALCEAILDDPQKSGQATLEYLERNNLFIVPLDSERRWYRYHHLFGDLLRQRLGKSLDQAEIAETHQRASAWYEANSMLFDAFRHAVQANDVSRAERLIKSKEMPLHLRSVALNVLDWLVSLPQEIKDARPGLWVTSATLALVAGQTTGVEARLQAAENSLQSFELNAGNRDLIGRIACARATLALTRYDPETMLIQAHRALEYLHPDNLTFLFTANWALTTAYLFQGDRAAAAHACQEGISISQQSGDMFSTILATNDMGMLQELDNQLHLAAETYHQVLQLFGEHPQPNASEALMGLARIFYEWNDLDAAKRYGQQGLQLAQQFDRVIDRFVISEAFLARLQLARGDVDAAADALAQTEQTARQKNFVLRLPDIAAVQVLVLLRQGNPDAALQLARQYDLHLCQARALLAKADPTAALAILEPFRQQMEAKGWQDERLRAIVLQAICFWQKGEKDQARHELGQALALAEPGGFIRLFVDEGDRMQSLISDFRASNGNSSARLVAYADKLLAAFPSPAQSEILTSRELEILGMIAEGLTNEQIANRLYLSLYTVKAHVRNIFAKLNAANRTQAVALARDLGILPGN